MQENTDQNNFEYTYLRSESSKIYKWNEWYAIKQIHKLSLHFKVSSSSVSIQFSTFQMLPFETATVHAVGFVIVFDNIS